MHGPNEKLEAGRPERYPEGYEGFKINVLPPVTRTQAVEEDPSVSSIGRLGYKPSSNFGGAHVDQTNSIDPATGEKARLVRWSEVVSIGAKRPGVVGDIHSSKSGL